MPNEPEIEKKRESRENEKNLRLRKREQHIVNRMRDAATFRSTHADE